MVFWQPLPGTFFQFEGNARLVMHGLLVLGFVIALISTFLIDHFHLFGLKQAYQALKTGRSDAAKFVTPLFYRWVRHPLMTGMLVVIWSMADISLDRLFLNVAMTGYIAVGVYFEERALTRELGEAYRIYKSNVPAVIPGLHPAWPPKTEQYQGPSAAPEAA
jgi:protein-S-isoprenylcysteine O-methyltransferase Ste14